MAFASRSTGCFLSATPGPTVLAISRKDISGGKNEGSGRNEDVIRLALGNLEWLVFPEGIQRSYWNGSGIENASFFYF